MSEYKIEWDLSKISTVLELVEAYVKKHGISECIHQSDEAQFDAFELACALSDATKPDYWTTE